LSQANEHIAKLLREAREIKGLNQRELSAAAGVPQSHISKIEKGAVDLRLSSLIELARALDLEFMLVPRPVVPAVRSIIRSATPPSENGKEARLALKELNRLEATVANNQSALPLKPEEIAQLQRQLRELPHFHLSNSDRKAIRSANQTIQAYLHDHNNVNTVRDAFAYLRTLRNTLAHRAVTPSGPEPVRPAYTLDEDDNA
jgi:transcriptional regulator with XRE-family HTH domain